MCSSDRGREPRYDYDHERKIVRISRRTYPAYRCVSWFGNWCWDGVLVTPETCANLLNNLKAMDRWTAESGWETLMEKWQGPGSFEAQDFRS